jgi:hypothetical protein
VRDVVLILDIPYAADIEIEIRPTHKNFNLPLYSIISNNYILKKAKECFDIAGYP